jgi:hypothetical protein
MIKAKVVVCHGDYYQLFATYDDNDEIKDILRKHCMPEGCNPNNHMVVSDSAISFIYRKQLVDEE